ncbi:hypothetical protein ACR3Z7_003325 [Klebsiella variicola]
MANFWGGKPHMFFRGGYWYCRASGFSGKGMNPKDAYQDMYDSFFEESWLNELTAKQRFFYKALKKRRQERLTKEVQKHYG